MVTHVRGWLLGVVIAVIIAACTVAASYALLNHFYGVSETEIIWKDVAPMTWENAEQSDPTVLTWENMEQIGQVYDVENVEWLANARLSLWSTAKMYDYSLVTYDEDNNNIAALGWKDAESSEALVLTAIGGAGSRESLPAPPLAVDSGAEAPSEGTKFGVPFIVSKTKPTTVLPISASIGVAVGFMVLAVWIGYRRMWGDAASTLLEQGLHDMTVRDVEIVGHIMELKEFTIPELMKLTKTSKITVWRTVQKMVRQELVQPSEKTKLAANGLGGRGKPSRIYRYVGKTKI